MSSPKPEIDAFPAAEIVDDPSPLTRRSLLRRSGALAAAGAAAPLLRGGIASAAPASRRSILALDQTDAKTLTIGADESAADLDPQFANDSASILAILGIYEGLLALDGDKTDKYVGLLAEKWEPNADKSVWTFHLRDGVKFHDGTPVDAEAVRASFERYLTVGLGSTSKRDIPGPEAVTAPDPKTVVFTLGRPHPGFEAIIAGTYGVYVVNTPVFKKHEDKADYGRAWAQTNAEGTGTGPYKLVSFDPLSQLVLEKNPDYWGGWAGDHFERVIIRLVSENSTRRQLLEQGGVDLVQTLTYEDLTALEKNPDLTITAAYSTRIEYFYLTVSGALLSPAARQAMCYAFPYKDVLDGVYKGYAKPARGICAEALYGSDPETFSFTTDLPRAKELLAQAGVAAGTTLEMAIRSGNEDVKTIAQLFQTNLDAIGIKLNITQMESASYVGMLYGDEPASARPNMMYWAWWPLYNDAWSHMHDLVVKASQGPLGGNSGFYLNPEVEDLMTQAGTEADQKKYLALLAKIQMIVNRDDPPAIYYAQKQQTVVARKNVTGIVLNAINIGTFYFYQMSRTA